MHRDQELGKLVLLTEMGAGGRVIKKGPSRRQWAEHGRDGGDAAGPAGDPRGHCGQGSGPGQQKGTMQSLEKVVAQSQLLGLSNEGLTTTLQRLQAVPWALLSAQW